MLSLEPFEERVLLSVNGPQLLAVIPATGTVIQNNTVLKVAPRELLLRFDESIDSNSLINLAGSSVQLIRSGDNAPGSRSFTNGNEVPIVPGYLAVGDNPFDVIVRFSDNLPDDLYQLTIVGAGSSPLRDTQGRAFNAGQDLVRPFTLDLGAQVEAVVPQPITRNAQGQLTQAVNQIDVYFNVNDPLEISSAQNRFFYQLIRTAGTANNQDDVLINPTVVTYNSTTGKAVLTFDTAALTTTGTYRLRIGTNEPLALAPATVSVAGAGDTFNGSAQLGAGGNPFTATSGTQTVQFTDTINAVAAPQGLVYPGSPDEPGERDPLIESRVNDTTSNNGNIPIFSYNFQDNYGTVQGQPVFNQITAAQKQRVREVFSYYAHYLGVEFVETATTGLTIITGDVRALNPDLPPLGIAGFASGGRAVMNGMLDWGGSETGGLYFQVAMHEIGHLLGFGHDYAAPAITVQGSPGVENPLGASLTAGEPVFPGDLDLIYGRYVWPALGNDINVYRFNLQTEGRLNLETIAERLDTLNLASSPSQLDTVISLYDANRNLIARNDDYYGRDSFLQLLVGPGTYYVAVTSTGNTNFDPNVPNSGAGGTSQGSFQMRMTFTPTVTAANSLRDLTGTRFDGDRDGIEGGVSNFWFKVDTAHTLFVDKAASGGTGQAGSITNPYTSIATALAVASNGSVVRIVGNGGVDGNLGTASDNYSYNVGFNSLNQPLSDGSNFNVPRGVTVMIDAGAIIKLRAANIDVGSSSQGVDRSAGAVQVLGTTAKNEFGQDVGSVYFTSYYNNAIGTDSGTAKGVLTKGDWGGLVFRNDSDLESAGIFLNYVNHAKLSWGGGKVTVNSVSSVYAPIHLITARPTITYNTITSSADSAISADPDSFEESEVLGPGYHADYARVGPRVYGNRLSQNSINGLFIRIRTQNGSPIDQLTVNARFASTDIVHVLNEVLLLRGQPGEFLQVGSQLSARPDARLAIDPGIILKLNGGRVETGVGTNLIAEGNVDRPIIITSGFDDRYGAGGTFDTTNDGLAMVPNPGDWGGFFFGPISRASLDYVYMALGGGVSAIEGGFATFSPVEINQAVVRITNSTFEAHAAGGGSERNGRSPSNESVIFIRGAQPVLVNNTIKNNLSAAISINVNSLNSDLVDDWGRSRGRIGVQGSYPSNHGPLIDNNLIGNNALNGMIVRGGTITTNSIWDDTDIVHVVGQPIQAGNQQSLTGTLRLQSTATESLVVKLNGTNTDLIASGEMFDTPDRVGGTLQIVGMPDHPVVLTSLKDDTVGAGLTPEGLPQRDTLNRKGVVEEKPPNLETQGPIILTSAPLDEHGTINSGGSGVQGWGVLRRLVEYMVAVSRTPNAGENAILAIGLHDLEDTGKTYSQVALETVADNLGLTLDWASTSGEINAVNFNDYKLVIIPSDAQTPLPSPRAQDHADITVFGGIADFQLAQLAATRKASLRNYVNEGGGGLLVLSQNTAADPYAFLADTDADIPKLVLNKSGGNVITQTSLTPPDFSTYDLHDGNLNAGLPWLYAFEGTAGFNRLEPWAVDPVTGEIAMLGLAPGGPGFGPAWDVVREGDWGTVRLDTLSNDRNVEIVTESEQRFTPSGDANQLPSTAEFLGELAKDQVSGDDNVRLGFEVHGTITQSVQSQGGGDVDVYSFRGTSGTEVWIDIDRTASSLDTVVELVDINGAVIARSNDSNSESRGVTSLVGIAKPLQVGSSVANPSPFGTADFYSSNPKDAGMRVTLPPGPEGPVNTYFVRVRANSSNLSTLTGGVTKGAYVMQLRLQQVDEFPGSTVRYANIRYSTNGIEVIGKPESSPLLSGTSQPEFVTFDPDTGELIDDSFETALDLGNLLASDQLGLSAVGDLSTPIDVDWYRFDMTFEQIQLIGGFSDGLATFASTLRINYADGLVRPDTTISIFDDTGTLLYVARDSQVVDALPRPNTGADTANLSHGSYGVLDPTLGPVQLPTGAPGNTVTYYVAVSSAAMLPAALSASFALGATTNPLLRLEPADGFARISEDHIGLPEQGNVSTSSPAQQLFPGVTGDALNAFADPYQLGDVVLFVDTQDGRNGQLRMVNPFTGAVLNSGGNIPGLQLPTLDDGDDNRLGYYDIAMRNDGRLYAFTQGSTDEFSGNYIEFNTATGEIVNADPGEPFDDALKTYTLTDETDFSGVVPNIEFADDMDGIQYEALTFVQDPNSTSRRLFAIGNRRTDGGGGDVPSLPQITNLLFELDPNTGEVMHRPPPGTSVWDENATQVSELASGTDAIPVAVFNSINGRITGMAVIGQQMYLVTNTGGLYLVTGWDDDERTDLFHLSVQGNIGPLINDNDWYDIGTMQPGDNITISMSGAASGRGTLADTRVELYRSGLGFSQPVVMDDNGGPGNDSLLQFTVTEGDHYYIKATNSNSQTGTYQLGVLLDNAGGFPGQGQDVAVEVEPNPVFQNATDLSDSWRRVGYLSQTSGTISAAADVDRFTYFFNPNELVTVQVQAQGGLSAQVQLIDDATGNVIAVEDGSTPGSDANILSFRIPSQGTYHIDVSAAAGTTGSYVSRVYLSATSPPAPPGNTLPVEIEPNDPPNNGNNASNNFLPISGGVQVNLLGTSSNNYRGLTAGPQNVEGGRYANVLFAVDANGTLHALNNLSGLPEPIFLNGQSSINTGVGGNAQGLAFSTLDYNLWHATVTRATDPGHGVSPSPTNNTLRDTGLGLEQIGGASFYFGLEPPSPVVPSQPGSIAYATNPELYSTYGLPGGAYGSITSNTFNLAGYTPYDLPTLYFNYLLDTDDVNSALNTALDVVRVMISDDGVGWSPLATSNVVLGNPLAENPLLITPQGGSYRSTGSQQKVQGLFESDIDIGEEEEEIVKVWRQARVDLGDFAGQSNLRLRFEFSTAGTMGSATTTTGTGRTLQALPGNELRDGDTFVIDGSDVFRFRSGFSLNVPTGGGALIADGETFTINGVTYEFEKGGGVSGTNRPIFITNQQSAENVAQAIFNVLTTNPGALNNTKRFGARLEVPDATSITQSAVHGVTVQGSSLSGAFDPGDILINGNMSAEEVAVAMAEALDRVLNTGANDLSVFTASKVERDRLRIFGHTVTSSGPLTSFSGLLPGDEHGQFINSSRDRHQGTLEGIYIDDIIIGLASRGEMVTNAIPDVDFVGIPPIPDEPTRILFGTYQLQVNPTDAYGSVSDDLGHISLDTTYNINDRFAPGYTLVAPPASQLFDGQTFVIDDGVQALTFEFDVNNSLNNASNVRVAVGSGASAASVATAIRNAVNGAVASRSFKVRASTALDVNNQTTGSRVDLFNALRVVNNFGSLGVILFGAPNGRTTTGLGDINGLANRATQAPGQTIIQNNMISDVQQVGIQVIPKIGQIRDTESTFTEISTFPVGSTGLTGAAANLPTINTRSWVPGVTVKNNLVVESGRTGIQVGGSPNAPRAYAQNGVTFFEFTSTYFRPFVRVVNNTVYGSPNGIAAVNASSATIVNNVIARTGVALTDLIRIRGSAVLVDEASGPPINGVRYGDSEIGTNVYQNNVFNTLGAGDLKSITLDPAEPLFVDEQNRNFYLAPFSRAIDSSVNSVQERPELQASAQPLGIPPSPIQAPERDLLGQLRVDDPQVDSPPGLGSNIFKDRGAIERADTVGPTAELINPRDNDPTGLDRNTLAGEVLLVNQELRDFTIQLLDGAGVGIDPNSISASKFVIEQTIGGTTRTLTPNVDYLLAYDTNADTAKLIPAQNIWVNATYKITLDPTIRDLAGNVLEPNVPPVTQFTIVLTDQIASRWQNPVLRQDVNNNGTVTGQDLLLIINRILEGLSGPLPLTGDVPWFVDVSGDGALSPFDALLVINYILAQSATPAAATAGDEPPMASPLASTVGDDGVASGLAMDEETADDEDDANLASLFVSTSTFESGVGAQSVAAPLTAPADDESLVATADADEFDVFDDELDSILADLTGDLA